MVHLLQNAISHVLGIYTHRCASSVSIDDWARTLARPLATIEPILSPGPLGDSSYCEDNVYLLVLGEKGIPGGGRRDGPAPRCTVAGD